jgi:uncharacterized protein YndB with AHSA1/START domain
MDRWWPTDSHSLSAGKGATARAVTMEPREGGALIETWHDGETHRWGTVKAWSPPERVVFSWHVGTPPENATTVEVTFEEQGRGTRVILVHADWDNAADPSARDRYESGWVKVFEERYAGACKVAA